MLYIIQDMKSVYEAWWFKRVRDPKFRRFRARNVDEKDATRSHYGCGKHHEQKWTHHISETQHIPCKIIARVVA